MNSEQKLFFSLLKDFINNTVTTVISAETDWSVLNQYAEQQSLVGVLYAVLKKLTAAGQSIPDDVLEQFHDGFFNDIYMLVNQQSFMTEVCSELRKKEIAFCPFKGWIIKNYWPVPELRTMGDIDILIHTEDRESTDLLFKELGYEKYVDNQAVWTYYARDMTFEIHDHMFYEHLANTVDYRAYFDNAWNYSVPELDENFHFLYLITHMAKHTVNNGMGFRAYLDLIFLCKNAKKPLDWRWICEELRRLKLLEFTKICFTFCQLWFGFDPPIKTERPDEAFTAYVTEKLFQDGTFGLTNEENDIAHSAKEITRTGSGYLTGSLQLSIYRMFPSYSDMQVVPQYSWINGKPWLMPIAWVYRWGYCLINKRKHGEQLLREPFEKKEKINHRQLLNKKWGL